MNLEGLQLAGGLLDSGPAGDELTLLSQGQPGAVVVRVLKNGSLTKGLLSASL